MLAGRVELGSIWFPGCELAPTVSEMVGYKAGVALSRDRMVELIEGSMEAEGFFDTDDQALVRVRSEELEAVVHELLFKLGHTSTPRRVHPAIGVYHRFKGRPDDLQKALSILEKWTAFMVAAIERVRATGERVVDPTPFLDEAFREYGHFGARVALQLFDDLDTMLVQNPWNAIRRTEWKDIADLEDLFRSEALTTLHGEFFDQRFIDYLARQFDDVDHMNWRKFEGLAGEYFHREGFQVKLGPGRNDEGVDARIWPKDGDPSRPPAILVQCKREKEKVSKVVLKALYADVLHEKAKSGLIVTTSTLSRGARQVRSARSYPIRDADRGTLRKWLEEMRSPGSGVWLGE
jgi:restriction system protein